MWDPYACFVSKKLSNGLPVHALHIPEREWSIVAFAVHAGAMQDPPGKEGTAHLLEHVFRQALLERSRDFLWSFEEMGGQADLMITGYFDTTYYFKVPAIDGVFDDLIDRLQTAASAELDRNMVSHERAVAWKEFLMRFPSESGFMRMQAIQNALYKGFWYGRLSGARPIGSAKSIGSIALRDLNDFKRAYYVPANMNVVSVGHLGVEALARSLEQRGFGGQYSGERTPIGQSIDVMSPLIHRRLTYEIGKDPQGVPFRKDAQYSSFVRIPGRCSLQATMVLLSMLEDVFMEVVRERMKETYGVTIKFKNLMGLYEIAFDFPSIDPEMMPTLEGLVDTLIENVGSDVRLFEHHRLKMASSASMVDLKMQDICDHAVDSLTMHGRIQTLQEHCDRLLSVSIEDVREVLEWFQPHRRLVSIIHP